MAIMEFHQIKIEAYVGSSVADALFDSPREFWCLNFSHQYPYLVPRIKGYVWK